MRALKSIVSAFFIKLNTNSFKIDRLILVIGIGVNVVDVCLKNRAAQGNDRQSSKGEWKAKVEP